ncbi:MAG: CaiB/BaiF CoA transferase family protein [Candidatus Helarchaeota archaeon]
MNSPLKDIKVLDLTRLLPGPFLTMLLGDYGAEVIKIEDPNLGDYVRWRKPFIYNEAHDLKMNTLFSYLNRNKKSLTLNLKSEFGREIFYKLAKNADIIVESFRPDVKYKLKIDYETIEKINPRIIYASLTGFGQNGPYMDIAGHDINYIAFTGILSLTGKYNGRITIPGTQIGDIGAGSYMGLNSILLALIAREKYDIGQYLDISIYDGLISWLPATFNDFLLLKDKFQKEDGRLIGELPWYNVYKTKDDKEIAIGALELKFWENFCNTINRPDLIELRNLGISEHTKIKRILENIFLEKTRDEWIEIFHGIDCCIAPVLNIKEVLKDPHLLERNLIIEYKHEKLGKIKQIGFSFKLPKTPGNIQFGAPTFGQHNNEILQELGYTKEQINKFEKEGIIKTENNQDRSVFL